MGVCICVFVVIKGILSISVFHISYLYHMQMTDPLRCRFCHVPMSRNNCCNICRRSLVVPEWAELKSCRPILDLVHTAMVKCAKCELRVTKEMWICHAHTCMYRPSQCRCCEQYVPVASLDLHWRTCANSQKERKLLVPRRSFIMGNITREELIKHLRDMSSVKLEPN